ncbi:DUF1740-domain-containing protein [Trematosphaeria pertusa]|uniref:DUF1740-domain-containing protein n=1 Tax=Trematosphaeria pertusa TaxID=390896 RepID=A0A6A6IAP1_9PLEO|nr:DUF1740-domain-containing protein [Trematosphaeria pertusa]KAF2247287.1 DUF1740-domain-containing protein [Trematosphaeria pertusa]
MASNVPKFTSFRPKPKEPDKAAEESRKAERPEKREKSEKPPKEKEVEERKQSKPSQGDERRSQKRDKEPSKLFASDRRGDSDILRYGGLNKYDIPAYRRYGYGSILGLPPDRKIDRELSSDKGIVVTPAKGRRQERLLTSKHVARESGRAIRFVKPSGNETDEDRDFIPFSITGKGKREEDEDASDVDYRGFERRKPTEPADPDAEFESDTEAGAADAEVTQKNAALIRRTREHPDDLQAWLDFIDHQEAMMKIDRSTEGLSSADRRHLADVRISTYEDALRKIGSDESSQVELHLGLMTEATKSWDDTRLAQKWPEVIIKFPWSTELWTKYLDFVQSSFASFKYEKCRATFFQCLKLLQASSRPVSSEFRLYILVRFTSMMQQAGYQELALAAWQAILEFRLLRPMSVALASDEERLRLFEEFWESEVPRIGELNAKGWKDFSPEDPLSTIQGPSPLAARNVSQPIFEDFWKREVFGSIQMKIPGRTTDEVGEDDPFHTVLFSDIRDFIQFVPEEISELHILDAFLRFCHLPPLPGMRTEKYWADPVLQLKISDARSVHADNQFAQKVAEFANCPIRQFQMSTQLLFVLPFPNIHDTGDAEFIRGALRLIASDSASDDIVGQYLLAFERNYFFSAAAKSAKRLLKARPASLRIYNAYGLVMSSGGDSDKADQVFSAALSMQKGDTPFSTPGSLELFSSWAWEALRPGQTALLRARTTLSETSERAHLQSDFSSAVTSASLSALLAYLCGGQKPESALATHHKLLDWFVEHKLSQSPAAELHAQSIAQFLLHHATHASIVKPSLIRTTLEPLIALFPDNTILLSLYAANEQRFSIDDRVRGIIHQQLLSTSKNRSIVGWNFAIHYETLKGEIAGSTAHSVRALYKRAEEDVGAHCPALWKQHVLFELEQARQESKKIPGRPPQMPPQFEWKDRPSVKDAYRRVKETFLRGMTHLPWCKEYMMMAFMRLGEEFLSEEELRRVYNVMVEKELRLYVELEDEEA